MNWNSVTSELQSSSETGATVLDSTFLLIDGKPARRQRTFRKKRFQIYDEETGVLREVEIPIERDLLIASHGI